MADTTRIIATNRRSALALLRIPTFRMASNLRQIHNHGVLRRLDRGPRPMEFARTMEQGLWCRDVIKPYPGFSQ